MHITFVCSGNTCRSPMAEGIFRKLLSDRKTDGITCSSCGVACYSGGTANPQAVAAAFELGADISSHRTRCYSPYVADETDLFVCMEDVHAMYIKSDSPSSRVTVLGGGIDDPYGRGSDVYYFCAVKIKKSLEKLLDVLTVKIENFSEEHVDGVLGIEEECFSAPWTREGIEAELQNENAHFLVAVSSDKTIGYIGVHEIAGEAYIANIAVKGEYRNLGAASRLLAEAENGARERGCGFITLEVRKSNIPAINLYTKRGYEVKGERKNFYTHPIEDALIMTLEFKETK